MAAADRRGKVETEVRWVGVRGGGHMEQGTDSDTFIDKGKGTGSDEDDEGRKH